MEKIVFCLFVIAVSVDSFGVYVYPKAACTTEFNRERDDVMMKSQCGEPKEVYIPLKATTYHEKISPEGAWVKKCVGLCDLHHDGTCTATSTKINNIPVRIFNSETHKESCATYAVEEHISCGCLESS